MNFTSLEFILFFPAILLIHWRMPARGRWILLLCASYLFYMNGSLKQGALLLFTTGISYLAAFQMEKIRAEKGAQAKAVKMWMLLAVVCCLGCLVIWKQRDILVVGISFYTFQTLAYVLDVYYGRIKCERHFGYYALFVSFFPQLVAGPIERTENLLPQLKRAPVWNRNDLADGCWLLFRGFYKKLVVADYLAVFVDIVYASPEEAGGLGVLIATLFFAAQIYCDFSGYTDIARGTARMLGVRLMENFQHPYGAANIREFWQRWHISLTKWFTDYVYIPLGGSRRGKLIHCRNIMLVFLLSGLWHGLAWNYVVWGLLHGICFVLYTQTTANRSISHGFAENRLHTTGYTLSDEVRPSRRDKYYGMLFGYRIQFRHLFSQLGTFAFVCFSWIFFRAENLRDAGKLIQQLVFHFTELGISQTLQFLQFQRIDLLLLPLVFLCLLFVERIPERICRVKTVQETAKVSLLGFYMVNAIAISWLIGLAADKGNSFIYFRF